MRTLLILLATLFSQPLSSTDLAKLYPATLDFFEGQPTREWTCTKNDVWELDSFHFEEPGDFELTLAKSVVVFGVHEKNVVWAVVLPQEPGTLKREKEKPESVSSIWMRFNPARLAELFPAKSVIGHGSEDAIGRARRLCTWKISSGWQAGNLPVIPKKDSLVLDCDTVEGPRRYLVVEGGRVELVGAFENRPLPKGVPMEPAAAAAAFDTVWDAFDKEYAKFALLPEVDWKKSGDFWRARAAKATTNIDLALALDGLTSELRDLHAWVSCGDEFFQSYQRSRPLNASYKALQNTFPNLKEAKHDCQWARTSDDIGYLAIDNLGDKELGKYVDEILEELKDTTALIVDLRFNGGGDELLAREAASRFVDKKRMYSKNQYRNGPKHDQLGPVLEREVEPRGPWRYTAPVVLLQGQKTFSSAESLAAMFSVCPQVTTMGDRTGGSSANPRRLELQGGVKVNLPRWNDMGPDGKPIEGVGLAPKIEIKAKPEGFTAVKDPVLEAALAHLRKLPKKDRRPSKR